jgi:hypothetical protein
MSFNAESSTSRSRTCGPCTACCDGWLKIKVNNHDVYPGKPCPYSSGKHCAIYETRPQHPCREFICGWLAPTSPLPEWMRPDKAQMILLPANFTWQGRPVDVAVTVGEAPRQKALEWLKNFSSSRGRMLLYQIKDEWFAFGPPAFQAEMHERISKGETPWI